MLRILSICETFQLFLEGKYISSKLQAEVVHLVSTRSEGQSREEDRHPGSFDHAVACTPAPAGRPADLLGLLHHSPLQGLGHRQAASPEAGPEASGQMHLGWSLPLAASSMCVVCWSPQVL